jgi:hypothetical protein
MLRRGRIIAETALSPAEDLPEFNANIAGRIELIAEFRATSSP